jgi:hypothetical protein
MQPKHWQFMASGQMAFRQSNSRETEIRELKVTLL